MDILAKDDGATWKLAATSELGAEFLGLPTNGNVGLYQSLFARKLCEYARDAGLVVGTNFESAVR